MKYTCLSQLEMVTLTHAPGGRTYIIRSRVLDPDIESGKKPRSHPHYFTDADYIDIETPFVVPNGKWVSERPAGWAQLICADWSDVETVRLDTRFGGMSDFYSTLYICDKPFGFVRKDMPDDDETFDASNAYRACLVYARQIYKGELGHGIHVPRPAYTRIRENQREYGWVRLEHFGEAAGSYRPSVWTELVLDHWMFSGHLRYENYRPVGTYVDVIEADNLGVPGFPDKVLSLTQDEFKARADKDTSDMWIRRGFAFTILRLQALGYQPVLQNA